MSDDEDRGERFGGELAFLRRRVAELEAAEAERERAESLTNAQHNLALALNAAVGIEETLRLCLGAAIHVAGMDCGGVYLVNEHGGLNLAVHTGLSAGFVEQVSHYDADSDRTHLTMAGKAIYSQHLRLNLPIGDIRNEGLQALATIPIQHEGKVIACLNVASHTRSEIPTDARNALETIASRIGNSVARVKAEAALLKLEENYHTMVDQAPIGIISCDRQGNIIDLNSAILQILGSPDKEASRQFNLLTMPQLVKMNIANDFRRCMEEGTPLVSERPYHSHWSKDMVVRMRIVPLKDKRGEVTGSMAVVEDITEQRQLEEQLRRAQRLEAVGTLAGGIAHEFNNLLTGIIGNLSLVMIELQPDSQLYQDLQSAERSARRATELTRQLLTVSRKPVAEQLERTNINSAVEEIVALMRKTIDRRIEIALRLAPDLWLVESNPGQINQVLMNLCLNARDAIMDCLQGKCFRPEKRPGERFTITIETENVTLDERYCHVHLEAQPGQFVRLSVSDNGCGMDAETQAQVYDPFFTTKEVGKGTGLGLPMALSIVKGHGGFINFYSEPGVGSTFRVYLPRAKGPEGAEVKDRAKPAPPPVGSEVILLVDDEESIRSMGRRILENLGYTVLLANDGQEALEIYRQGRANIDLVVLDLVMPRLSGAETLQGILQIEPGAKVILASGYSANGLGDTTMFEGALAFVQKPYDLYELALAARAALDGR